MPHANQIDQFSDNNDDPMNNYRTDKQFPSSKGFSEYTAVSAVRREASQYASKKPIRPQTPKVNML